MPTAQLYASLRRCCRIIYQDQDPDLDLDQDLDLDPDLDPDPDLDQDQEFSHPIRSCAAFISQPSGSRRTAGRRR
jgi:hypothetical protein